jgi:hypothetical protein
VYFTVVYVLIVSLKTSIRSSVDPSVGTYETGFAGGSLIVRVVSFRSFRFFSFLVWPNVDSI